MKTQSIPAYQIFCKSFSRFAAIFTIIVSILVLLGWQFDITLFKSMIPSYTSMNPMTAVCFLFLSVSFLIQHSSYNTLRYSIAVTCASLVLLVALSRLSAIFFGFDLNIDQLLFTSKLGSNHIAPNTAFNLIFLSICQLTLRYPRNPYRHFFVLLSVIISFMAIVGYAYNVHSFYQIPAYISMALNTAIIFFILSCGILCFDPNYGFMHILTNTGVSGDMSRRLLPQSVGILLVMGWLRLMSARLKYFDVEFGILLFVICLIVAFVFMIWYLALIMERIDIRRQQTTKELEEEVEHRREAERALRKSEELYRSLFNSIDEGFCIVQMIFDEKEKPRDFRYLQVNPSFEKQSGLKDVQGKRIRELAPELESNWFEIFGNIALTGQPVRFENRAEELSRWYDVYAFRFGEPENRQVAILFNDITERKRGQDEIQKKTQELKEAHVKLEVVALTDPLTGILNRRGFETHVQERFKVIKRNKQNAFLLFIDIDKMKWINDTLGHKEGDAVLVEVANILKNCSRDTDITARLGGDEFSMFLTLTNVGDENFIIKRLQEYVDRRNAACKPPHHPFSLSIGGAVCNVQENCDLEALLSQADKKMYIQKGSKKRQ